MAYSITLKRSAIKALEKINEPYYSNIRQAIYDLADNPRPAGFKKLRVEMVIGFVWLITGLFMKSLMIFFWLMSLISAIVKISTNKSA